MTTGIIVWIILFLLFSVFIIVVSLRAEREERAEQEKRAREEQEYRKLERFLTSCKEEMLNDEEEITKMQLIELAELNQQKQEIEKQVFKADEYNLYVAEQIIEKMCLARLRKEYTDHSYILYEKLLEDIEKVKDFNNYYLNYLISQKS